MKKKFITVVLIFLLIGTLISPISSVSAAESNCKCNTNPVTDAYFIEKGIEPVTFSDEQDKQNDDIELALEIAKSQLEEKAVVTEDGYAKNYFQSAEDANVSKEAFVKFESMLIEINKLVDLGEIAFEDSLLDVKTVTEAKGSVTTNADSLSVKQTEVKAAGAMYFISHSQTVKAQKLLLAGVGVALLAAELGVPMIVASGLTAIAGGIGVCDWNDRGFYLVQMTTFTWTCMAL